MIFNSTIMSSDFLTNNAAYAATFGDKGGLALPPAKKLAVGECPNSYPSSSKPISNLMYATVTCMDARIE
jgi:predicted small lipoprotein YifL